MARLRLDYSFTRNLAHDDDVSKVVEILQTSSLRAHALSTRLQIAGAAEDYRAAVTGLVIEGALNIDDGRQLLGLVEAILREEGVG